MDGTVRTFRFESPFLSQGFSLYELIASLAVGSILIALAIPSLQSLVIDAQVRSARSALLSMLATARTAAVDKRQRVALCRTENNNSCAGYSKSGTKEWTSALLFLDSNYNNVFDNTEHTLGWFDLEVRGAQINWNRGDMMIYDSDGTARGGSNGTFKIVTSEGEQAGVVISLTGRYRVASY